MAKTERIFTAELTVIASADNLHEMTPERIRKVEKHLEQAEGFDHVKIVKVQDHTFPDQEKAVEIDESKQEEVFRKLEEKGRVDCRKSNPVRVYISGPISNNPAYMLDFKDAEQRLTEQGYIAFNPAAVNSQMPADATYEEYMQIAMTMLAMCDAIYLLKGWERSRGANREYGYAMAAGMKIMREEEE